ncbi:MAG: DMT family transporter [Clostridiales bacterium]|nr:DMT family transporter [Clostridiales bacterium]MDY4008865.1 EamA family transporter [Candidatus Limiplasma sp.]
MTSGVLIYLITPLLSAVSQLILKKAADQPKYTGVRTYLNAPVILAYALFFGCMLLNVVALRTLDLTVASVLEASGYIYVMALSFLVLKEKITPRRLIGNLVIILGIVLTLTL